MFTSIAVVLAGAWLIIYSQEKPSTTLTLVFGIVIVVLALIDLLRPYVIRNRAVP